MSSTPSRSAAGLARALGILLAVALTVLLTTLAGPAQAADPGGTLGVYAGSGSPDAVSAFEARLGRNVAQVHDFQPKDQWSAVSDIAWALRRWNASRYAHHVTYSIPMLPDSGGTLAEGATGAFNSHFRSLAQNLVAGGDGAATLRLGWEFNGDWFKWSIGVANGPADYAAYWRQIVTTMRSVPGANFKFDWCPNNGSSYVGGKALDAASAYPGDAYVDYIGMDVYDQSWSAQRGDPSVRWNDYVSRKDGLGWQRDFAAAHGKRMSFPEWGIGHRTDGHGGGDAPEFIERMYEWIRTGDVAYHNYFEFSDGVLDAKIFDGRSPKAAARFVELFGPGSTGGPLDGGSPPAAPAAPAGAGDTGAGAGAETTSLSITRARITRRSQRLELIAPISRLATGTARVDMLAGGRRTSFDAKIDSGRGMLRVNRAVTRRQARGQSAIVTISYPGNARTLPKQVRLRAAARAAKLTASRPALRAGRLLTRGTVAKAARGVVRLELAYNVDGRNVVRKLSATIRNGRWSLSSALSPADRGRDRPPHGQPQRLRALHGLRARLDRRRDALLQGARPALTRRHVADRAFQHVADRAPVVARLDGLARPARERRGRARRRRAAGRPSARTAAGSSAIRTSRSCSTSRPGAAEVVVTTGRPWAIASRILKRVPAADPQRHGEQAAAAKPRRDLRPRARSPRPARARRRPRRAARGGGSAPTSATARPGASGAARSRRAARARRRRWARSPCCRRRAPARRDRRRRAAATRAAVDAVGDERHPPRREALKPAPPPARTPRARRPPRRPPAPRSGAPGAAAGARPRRAGAARAPRPSSRSRSVSTLWESSSMRGSARGGT